MPGLSGLSNQRRLRKRGAVASELFITAPPGTLFATTLGHVLIIINPPLFAVSPIEHAFFFINPSSSAFQEQTTTPCDHGNILEFDRKSYVDAIRLHAP